MARAIYITHCSKDKILSESRGRMAVDELHIGQKFFQPFISRCLDQLVEWAVLCDGHGVVLPSDRIAWYDRAPDELTMEDRQNYALQLALRLPSDADVVFYGNLESPYFSPVHHDILQKARTMMGSRLRLITHKVDIR